MSHEKGHCAKKEIIDNRLGNNNSLCYATVNGFSSPPSPPSKTPLQCIRFLNTYFMAGVIFCFGLNAEFYFYSPEMQTSSTP